MKRRNGNKDRYQSSSLSSAKGSQESKPCEICGSVGIEDLIMICFKCRETREHTYCARVLLPSVPPIWLCEVCRSSSRRSIKYGAAVVDLMDLETTHCASEPKNSTNSGEKDHVTAKLRAHNMEEAGVSLPVILQTSTSDSGNEISGNVICPPSQPHTSPVAKKASSVLNDTSQDKEQHQLSQAVPKKPRTFRLIGKHQQTLISSLD
ncbi:unnamed protein product [Microthlaspi erraticum]|uniref:Zinc finger PHD-type domain-containing protein n=1 Tax=Microthlaspi erraticum TaxID=1685480 RepID=A0A6D2IZY6_9BRAS|nr:unnamed protein product [Microthlaspi erraticum]